MLRSTNFLLPALAVLALPSCQPTAPAHRESAEAAPVAVVEERPDGYCYVAGTEEKFTGVYQKRAVKGFVQAEQHYQDGLKHGPYLLFTETGELRRRIDYLWGDIQHDRRWYENGQLEFDKEMQNGVAEGLTIQYFPNGQIQKVLTIEKKLRIHGQLLEFDAEGNVIQDAIYKNGTWVRGTRTEPTEPTVLSALDKSGGVSTPFAR